MSRWFRRLAELASEAGGGPLFNVQIVQSVQNPSLEQRTQSPAPRDPKQGNVQNIPFERSEQFEHCAGGYPYSADLASCVERLRALPCPPDEPAARFERYRQGALRFAAEHAAEARACGWSRDELFAVAEPFANLSRRGAAWFIGDATVTEISAAAITVRTASGAEQRIYRKSLQ